ncbi:MAG: hypothetical protein US96_C0011G0018 [Candidatus Woesebacteria bacterium GW2011_GWB1_38_5b]|uniref:Uncharacterized protein n=1 Tax=Candidatus Woesebacteria bacterium GW2011_GWB1_38_5b TaxID=1618569 RepID=A0A0G0KIR8_9BACT|nr:MAG: hypothetical protein US96_C0011G0018 [Candidatus Woesebacteria bacterium GW2011_GWB1_38_5b]OGH47347.1 MAG: hypothetical protein A3A51_01075 [Candidatus Levybacteria bacterium RIFCSPLOWO2_01_FULL_39_10]
MEGKLGRLLERVGLQEPQQREGENSFDYLNRRSPGMGDRLRSSMEQAKEPHIAHELHGVTFVPVHLPGFRAIDAARAAGEPIPPITPVTEATPEAPQPGENS